MKYLDPKADLTFKKIFGTHPDLLISLLNALLPLDDDQQIESVTYLQPELVPSLPLLKNTIVDVRCRDIRGRQFVVEMQMEWTTAFKQRVLFNASKAYVSQAEEGYLYQKLQPVYSLNFVNAIFERDVPEFIHNYSIVHEKYSDKVIEGLHFTFIELPKFHPQTMLEKRMAVLWLRFLTEINSRTERAPEELLENPATHKALQEVEKSAFTPEELLAYDKFWDAVWSEKTLQKGKLEEGFNKGMAQGMEKGLAKGMKKGLEQGREEGLAQGREEGKLEVARAMLQKGMDIKDVCGITGLSEEEIKKCL